jgi:hypothetical protein
MTTSNAARGSGGGRQFNFTVDDKPVHSATSVLTGAQIKAMAGVDPAYGLFLQGHGGAADRQIGDTESINLEEPGREKFYSAPPATYGIV